MFCRHRLISFFYFSIFVLNVALSISLSLFRSPARLAARRMCANVVTRRSMSVLFLQFSYFSFHCCCCCRRFFVSTAYIHIGNLFEIHEHRECFFVRSNCAMRASSRTQVHTLNCTAHTFFEKEFSDKYLKRLTVLCYSLTVASGFFHISRN